MVQCPLGGCHEYNLNGCVLIWCGSSKGYRDRGREGYQYVGVKTDNFH